jgi:serine/threonine protein kinase
MEIYLEDFTSSLSKLSFKYSYNILSTIGSGAFGIVVKAIEISTEKIVAVKILNIRNSKIKKENIIKEVNLLKNLNHPNIVKFLDFYEEADKIYIVMEYYEGGTLKQYIQDNQNKINEDKARIIIKQLLNALSYLHYVCDICHRDIKPENIMLLKKDDINTIKLLDFGLSSDSFESKSYMENCGTLIYMAPEQINNMSYSKIVDIWSVGIILYMLLNNGKNPFYTPGENSEEIINRITKGKLLFDDENFPICKMCKKFLYKLLKKNPSYRYTARTALEHPWITLKKYDKIPLTVYDTLRVNEFKDKMKILFYTVLFIKNQDTQYLEDNLNEYELKVILSNDLFNRKFKEKRDKMFEKSKKCENEIQKNNISYYSNKINDKNYSVNNINNINNNNYIINKEKEKEKENHPLNNNTSIKYNGKNKITGKKVYIESKNKEELNSINQKNEQISQSNRNKKKKYG